jgi:hypothetical protein
VWPISHARNQVAILDEHFVKGEDKIALIKRDTEAVTILKQAATSSIK